VIELRHSIRAAKLRVAYREASCRFSVRRPLDRGIAGPHAEGGREQATRHWLPAQDNSGVALESLQNQAHLQKKRRRSAAFAITLTGLQADTPGPEAARAGRTPTRTDRMLPRKCCVFSRCMRA